MSTFRFTQLDCNDPIEVQRYEEAMYSSFVGATATLHLTREIDEIHKRVRLKVPYESQTVLLAYYNDEIIAASGFNDNTKSTFNLELVGFEIDKSEQGIAESTGVFCTQLFVEGQLVLKTLLAKGWSLLRQRGVKTFYGYCNESKIRFYRNIGFTDIKNKIICGEKIYLLKTEL